MRSRRHVAIGARERAALIMIRIVLDTNVVVSAMLRSGSLPEAIFNLAMEHELQLCASEPVLAEYEEVLRRPRLAIDPGKVTGAMARIRATALPVRPVAQIAATLDPDDNIFLECAVAAQAHCLVTGNRRHFPESWGTTRILTPRQFMDALALPSDASF